MIVRIPATSYLVPLFTLIYLVLFHLLPPYHLDVPCYLNNRQRYCSVWSERLGLFTAFSSLACSLSHPTLPPIFLPRTSPVGLFLSEPFVLLADGLLADCGKFLRA